MQRSTGSVYLLLNHLVGAGDQHRYPMPGLKGEKLKAAVDKDDWDESVKSLADARPAAHVHRVLSPSLAEFSLTFISSSFTLLPLFHARGASNAGRDNSGGDIRGRGKIIRRIRRIGPFTVHERNEPWGPKLNTGWAASSRIEDVFEKVGRRQCFTSFVGHS